MAAALPGAIYHAARCGCFLIRGIECLIAFNRSNCRNWLLVAGAGPVPRIDNRSSDTFRTLSIFRSDQNVIISWPSASTAGFSLELSPVLHGLGHQRQGWSLTMEQTVRVAACDK